jgi:hypothetical protein
MALSKSIHLEKEEMIKKGSYFTPKEIVKIARSWLECVIGSEDFVVDFGVGYGAFISEFLELTNNCIATDLDQEALRVVKREFPQVMTFEENSLVDIGRHKYGIPIESKLIVIGNPPYNDLTSQYKKGEKGIVLADKSVQARDLGISFMKMYAQLEPEYICILHPLSYLIKRANFKSLDYFANWYALSKAIIFSSKKFENIEKGTSEFPVVLALYERKLGGMRDFQSIENFEFGILHSNRTFSLRHFLSVDNWLKKYPSKDKDDEDLQFYTLRDINALKRNRTFLVGQCNNGVKVDIPNLYKYAWLDYFKCNFAPEDTYIYGNLSPLYSKKLDLTEFQKLLISYILAKNTTVYDYYNNKGLLPQVMEHYKLDKPLQSWDRLYEIMNEIMMNPYLGPQ